MEEGQLKKRIADFIKVRSTDMYVDPETTAAHREVEVELSSVVDEAKKEFPLKEEQYKANWNPTETAIQDIWTLDPDEITAWFRKWFGGEKE